MPTEKIDFVAALADAKAKRAALDAFIASLEAAIAAGALGFQVGDATVVGEAVSVSINERPVELPVGAFLNKSLTASIKLYLAAVKKKQTIKEIATALQEGGAESTGSSMEKVVSGTLYRLQKEGDVLKFKDGWSLAEHYNESLRSRLSQNQKPARKGKKRGPKPKVGKGQRSTGMPKAKATTTGIEAILHLDRTKAFTVAEIASKLGTTATGLQLTLGKMAKARKAERCPDGRYRAFAGSVQQMPKAV